jgi:heme-degrading monooxygenase HmoA
MATSAVRLSELPETEVEIHQRVWVRRERLAALDALRGHVHVKDVPGLRIWRTLLPTVYTGDEDMLPYVIVTVWANWDAFESWRRTSASEDYSALLAEAVADHDVRAPEVTVFRVTRMEVR